MASLGFTCHHWTIGTNLITMGKVRPAKSFRCLAAKSLAVVLDHCGTLLHKRIGLSLDDFIPMDIALVAVTV